MKTYIHTILLIIILIGLSCREEPTEPPTAQFSLTAEDIGVTDVFFRVKATLTHGPYAIEVKRNEEKIYPFIPTSQNTFDTLLYDDCSVSACRSQWEAIGYDVGAESTRC